jgi:hypothetical protein
MYHVKRNADRIFLGKPEGKRPLWRLRHRWEGNIKIEFRELECDVIDRIDLAHGGLL